MAPGSQRSPGASDKIGWLEVTDARGSALSASGGSSLLGTSTFLASRNTRAWESGDRNKGDLLV